jgi:RNA polymerase sigma-70 factor (ECF subfamily)
LTQDADLVRRLAVGDPSALDEAYHAYGAGCRAVAYRILHDDALAQDALQEALLALWRHRSGLVVCAGGVRPWLVVATRNAALGIIRSASRRSVREQATASLESDAADPTDVAIANIEAADVREAVSELPPEQRTVIAMAYFADTTLAQIATRTRAPLGTVKRRAQLGLAKLARLLGNERR